MDDFGNDYQTDEWMMCCGEYGHSMATFGMLDDGTAMACIDACVDYAACDV